MGNQNQTNGGETDKMMDLDVVVSSLKDKLSTVSDLSSECCIFKVPAVLRKVNEEAYTPKLVSIGPYHRGVESLKPMEVNKLRYLNDFIGKELERTLEFYVGKMKGLEERARKCYSEHINLTSEEFVEMMVIDGCFVIGFMLRYCGLKSGKTELITTNLPIKYTLLEDMELMENQLPFFVLDYLFKHINSPLGQEHWEISFTDLTLSFFDYFLRKGQGDIPIRPQHQIKHFLDLYRQRYVPSSPRAASTKHSENFQFIPCATELRAAGVRFEVGHGNCFLDIQFTKDGVLKIPAVRVQHTIEVLLRNLIAFEYFSNDSNYITDYAYLLDSLINTPQDVALLRSRGIISNWLGDDDDVALLFNKLAKGAFTSTKTFYYAGLCEDVNAYYKTRWHVWRAKLKRDYFNTPWSTLSIIAAIILLILTTMQTVYTVVFH